MERGVYWIWEASAFLLQISVAMGLLVLRRKASGGPAFADENRQSFFGQSPVAVSTFGFWTNFGIAALLCYFTAFLEQLIFAHFGASVLATAELLTLLGIIERWLW